MNANFKLHVEWNVGVGMSLKIKKKKKKRLKTLKFLKF